MILKIVCTFLYSQVVLWTKNKETKKYTTIRMNSNVDPCNVQTKFIGIEESEVGGADGLLDCLKQVLGIINLRFELIRSKLIGVMKTMMVPVKTLGNMLGIGRK